MKIRIHHNRKNKKLPWTLHTSKKCYHCSHLTIATPIESEEKPDNKTNPRYFFKTKGYIKWNDTKADIIPIGPSNRFKVNDIVYPQWQRNNLDKEFYIVISIRSNEYLTLKNIKTNQFCDYIYAANMIKPLQKTIRKKFLEEL